MNSTTNYACSFQPFEIHCRFVGIVDHHCFVLFHFLCFFVHFAIKSRVDSECLCSNLSLFFFLSSKEQFSMSCELLLVSFKLALQCLLLSIASYSFTIPYVWYIHIEHSNNIIIIILFFLVFLDISSGLLLYVDFKYTTIQKKLKWRNNGAKLVGNVQHHSNWFDSMRLCQAYFNLVDSMRLLDLLLLLLFYKDSNIYFIFQLNKRWSIQSLHCFVTHVLLFWSSTDCACI